MSRLKYAVIAFLGGCAYGFGSPFVKLAYKAGFTVENVTGIHFLIGPFMLCLVALFSKKEKLSFKNILLLLICGFPIAITSILYNSALTYIDASLSIILLMQFTWIGTLLHIVFYKIKPDRATIIGVAIILIGSLLASGITSKQINVSYYGVILGLLSAISFAVFIFFSGQTNVKTTPTQKSAIMSLGGMIMAFMVMPPVFLYYEDFSFIKELFFYAIFISFLGMVVPTLFFNISMPKVGALGNILSASELPTAMILATLVLHEKIDFIQWIGIFFIILGIALPTFAKFKIKTF